MKVLRTPKILIPMLLLLAGCDQEQRAIVNYEMGERVEIGSLTYIIVESSWRGELGEGFQTRTPANRFLQLSLSLTNGGGAEDSVPRLSIEGSNGQIYQELSDVTGVSNWLGVLRTVKPAETLQGRILFDAPLGAYKLRLPEGGETGYEKYVWVNIPLNLGAGEVQAPLPGGAIR
jgi:hypothetical protein